MTLAREYARELAQFQGSDRNRRGRSRVYAMGKHAVGDRFPRIVADKNPDHRTLARALLRGFSRELQPVSVYRLLAARQTVATRACSASRVARRVSR